MNSRPANGGRHGHSLLLHRYYCCTPKTGGFTGDEPIHANIAQYATTTTRLVSLPVVAAAAAVALPTLAASPLRVDDFILLYYVEQTSRLKDKVHEKKMFKSHSMYVKCDSKYILLGSYYTYCLIFFLIESIISTGRSQ